MENKWEILKDIKNSERRKETIYKKKK